MYILLSNAIITLLVITLVTLLIVILGTFSVTLSLIQKSNGRSALLYRVKYNASILFPGPNSIFDLLTMQPVPGPELYQIDFCLGQACEGT